MAHCHLRAGFRSRVRRVWRAEPLHLGGISGTFAVWWGVWVVLPMHSFNTRTYAAMLGLLPEWAWGWAVAALGAAQLWAALADRPWRLQAAANFCTCLVWCFVALLFGLANFATTGVPMYSGMAVLSGMAYARRLADRDRS